VRVTLYARKQRLCWLTTRIQKELDAITEARQWVIRMARTRKITDEDMDHQLVELDLQELHLKKELDNSQALISISDSAALIDPA